MAAVADQINVEALSSVLKQVNTTYSALKALDSQMDATLISKFAKLAQGVNQFVNALRGLDILKVEVPDMTVMTKTITEFFEKIGALNNNIQAIAGNLDSSPIVRFSNAFYRLLLSFKDLNKIELDVKILDGFQAFFQKLNEIVDSTLLTVGKNAADVESPLAFFNSIKNIFLSVADFIQAIAPKTGIITESAYNAIVVTFHGITRFVGELLKTIGNSNIKGIKDIQQNYTNTFSSVLLDVTTFLTNLSPFLSTIQALAYTPETLVVTLDAVAQLFVYFNAFVAGMLKSIGDSNIRGVMVLLQKDYTGVIPIILQDLSRFIQDFIPFLTLVQTYASAGGDIDKTLRYVVSIFTTVNTFIGALLQTIGDSNIKGFFVLQKSYLDVVPVVMISLGDFLTKLAPVLSGIVAVAGKKVALETAKTFLLDTFTLLNAFIGDLLATIGNSNIKGLPIIQKNYLDVIPVVLGNVATFITTLVPMFTEIAMLKLTPASVKQTTDFLTGIFAQLNMFVGNLLATIGNSNIKGFWIVQKSYMDVFPLVIGEVAGFIVALGPLFQSLLTSGMTATDVENATTFLSTVFMKLNIFIRNLLDTIGNSNIKGFFVIQKSYLDVFPIVLKSVAEFTTQIFQQFSLLAASFTSTDAINATLTATGTLFVQLNAFVRNLLAGIGDSNLKGFLFLQKSYLDVFPIVLKSVGDFLSVIIPQVAALSTSTAGSTGAQLNNARAFLGDLLKQFSFFTQDILDAVGDSNIRGFFVFQKDYSKIFVIVLESVGAMLVQITPLIRELSAAKGLSEDFQTRTVFFRSVLASITQFLADLIDALPRRNITSIILLRKVFLDALPLIQGLVTSVTGLVQQVSKSTLSSVQASAFQVILDSMLTVIRQLYTFTVQTSKADASKLVKVLPVLIAPLDAFANIMSAFAAKGTSEIKTSALAAIFQSFTDVITIIQNATAQVAANLKTDGYFKTWVSTEIFLRQTMTVLGAIQKIFDTASLKENTSASYKAIAEVFSNIPKLLTTVQEVVMSILANSAFTESSGFLSLAGLAVKYRIVFGAVRDLLDIFNTYLVNIAGLKGISPTLITSIVQIFTATQQIVAAVLNFEMPKGFVGNVKALFQYGVILPMILNSVKQITSFFEVLEAARNVDPKSVVAIGQMFNAMRELAVMLLNADTWTKLAADAPKWSSGVRVVIQAIRSISDMVVGLLEAARTVPSESIAGLGNIFKGIGELFPGLASIISTIAATVSGNIIAALVRLPIQLISLRNVFGQVMQFVTSIIKSTDGWSTDKISAVGTFARGLGELFAGLGNVFKSLAQSDFATINPVKILKNIVSMELVIYPLKRVLSVITENAKDLDTDKLSAISQFARFVGEALTALGKVFAEVKYASSGILEIIKSVYLYNRVTAPLLTLVKTLANIPSSGANLAGGSEYIESIGRFLEKFAKMLNEGAFAIDESKIKAVAPFFKAISSIFSQTFKVDTKALKGLKDLSAASKDLENLLTVANILEKFSKVNIVAGGSIDLNVFKGIGEGVILLAKGLDKLTKEQLSTLIAVSEALSKLPVEALSKALDIKGEPKKDLGEIRDISEDVAQGMQRATLRAALFNGALALIGGTLSALDPRRVVDLLVNGFARATEALVNLKAATLAAFNDIREMGERIRGVGNSIIDTIGIGKLVNSDIFKVAVEFDKLGSSLEVFGGLSKEQRKEAEEFANVLGKDYPLSANEALKATLDLVKAGQGFESAQSILPSAADLASLSDSGSIENATSFIIQATSAFRDFNETAKATYENASTAVDIISAAADTSTASVEGLAEGLKNVGPVAANFGLSLEETTAILAIFTDGGIEGAEAGTQLKSMLTNLTTTGAQKELRRLGVALSDSTGNIRPMNDILNDLQEKFTQTSTVAIRTNKGLNAQQKESLELAQKALATARRNEFLIGSDLNATGLGKNAEKAQAQAVEIAANAERVIRDIVGSEAEAQYIFKEISRTQLQNATSIKKVFGSYGQGGGAILLAQGQDALKEYIALMHEVEPASIRAKKALDNINGDMIQLQGSVETLTTKALVPLLEKFFRPFVQIGRFFIDSLLTINDETLEFVATALALGSTLATLIGGIVVVTGALIQLGGAVGGVVTFLALGTKALTIAFLGALTGVAAGVAALAASFLIFTPILAAITVGFDTLSKIFTQNLGGATTQLENLAQRVAGALGQIGTALGQVIGFVVEVVSGGGFGSLEDVGEKFASFFNSISLSVTKFQTSGAGKTLMDLGNILNGLTTALTLDARSDAAAAGVADTIESANRLPQAAARARKAVAKSYAELIVGLTKNNSILQGIFGKNVTVEQTTLFFDTMLAGVEKVRGQIGSVFDSFGSAFEAAKTIFDTSGGDLGLAMNTFFTSLGTNLDDALGNLSGTILDYIGVFFQVDTSELSKIFSTDGFVKGVSTLIQKALASLKKTLLSNRGNIKGFLTSIFENIFLGTLNIGKFVADALGQEGIGDFIGGIIESLKTVFGGLVDTVFNIIAGQDILTALKNAFGPGIAPFLNLVDSLGKAVDNIVGFIGILFKAIFQPPPGAAVDDTPFLLKVFNGIVGGLTTVIDFLNNNILNFLKTGDIGGLITNLVNGIGASINALNLPEKFSTAAASILNGLVSAVQTAFLSVTGALNIDPSNFIASIGVSLTGFFDTVRNVFGGADGISIFDNIVTIVEKLKTAFALLFGVFSSSEAAATESRGPTIQSVLQNLFNGIGNISAGVIGTITDLADGLDKLIGALALLNPAELLAFTSAMSLAGGILAVYAGGPAILTAFGAGFTAFSAGLTTLANSFLVRAGAFIVILQFIRAIAQNLDQFTVALKSLTEGDLAGTVGDIIGGILNVITDFGANLGIVEGVNVIGRMLGIDTLAEASREDLERFGLMFGKIIEAAVGTAGAVLQAGLFSPIQDFIDVTIPLLLSELEKMGTSLAARLPGGGEQLKQYERLLAIDATALGQIKFTGGATHGLDEKGRTPMEAFIEDVVNAGGPQTIKRLGAQAARDNALIYAQAVADFDWSGTLDAETQAVVQPQIIADMVKFFQVGGISDEILTNAVKGQDFGFLQALVQGMLDEDIVITPEMQAKLASSISEGFNLLDSTGVDTRLTNLDLTISTFANLGLDTTQLEAERARLQTIIDNYLKTDTLPDPTEVPVTVTPVVSTTPPTDDPYDPNSPNYIGKALFRDEAGVVIPVDLNVQPNIVKLNDMDDDDILTVQAGAQGQLDKIAATTPLANFDVATLTDPAAVENFNALVGTLITNIQLLAGELTGVAGQTEPVTTALTAIQGAVTIFRDVSVPLFTEVNNAIIPIAGSINSITSALFGLFATATVGFPAMTLTTTISVGIMAGQFAILKTAADTSLNSVITRVRELAGAFQDAATQAKALGTAGAFTSNGGGLGGGGDNPPGRAGGGSTRPYGAYEVHDTEDPEIYNDGKRSILLTGRDPGYVTPLSDIPNLASNRSSQATLRNPASGSTNSAISVTINEGAIQVTIPGASGLNESQLVSRIVKEVSAQQAKNSQRLSDRLRTNNR